MNVWEEWVVNELFLEMWFLWDNTDCPGGSVGRVSVAQSLQKVWHAQESSSRVNIKSYWPSQEIVFFSVSVQFPSETNSLKHFDTMGGIWCQ